jgi:hypothetical protein
MLLNKPEMLSMVIDQSVKAEIDPALACAVVHGVSQWLPASLNHAPSDLIPGFDMSYAEAEGWQTTYGLFQFTGQQAREAGYKGKFNDLLDPSLNVSLGVEILRKSLRVTPKLETGLIVYLNRGRAMMVPGILSMVEPYQKLIAERPGGLI